jgi:amphi-Trp domain-containing protein
MRTVKGSRRRKGKRERDIEKVYSTSQFVAKLRWFAEALEKGKKSRIQIAGERVYVPVRAQFNIEHEGDEEEIEFQIRWTNP